VKICDLTQFYSPVSGGVKRYIHEKVAYLRSHRPDCSHLLVVPGPKDEVTREPCATVFWVRSPLIARTSRYRALLRLRVVEEILEREKPDIIESGDPYQMAWKAIASGVGLRIPVVGFYHSHFPEAYLRTVGKYFGATATELMMDIAQHYVRSLYNRFERTLVPSPALADVLKSWGVENVTNIDLGVNTAIFRPAPGEEGTVRAELRIPDDRILLLYVGRLAQEKNTRTLFDAFALLTTENPGRYHLLVIGDGTQRELLRELQKQTRAVTWLKYCGDSAELARMYRAADLFVHPGVQETFGLVALESQACGTPIVGIRGSYMDRIIFNTQHYWAVENSPEALGHAIATKSGADLKSMGAEASREVLRVYSWERVFERLFEIYEAVAKNTVRLRYG
jgi:alpha-1,6-mannosyltransferase